MLKVGITCRYMYQSALNMDQHEPNTKEVLVKAFGRFAVGDNEKNNTIVIFVFIFIPKW